MSRNTKTYAKEPNNQQTVTVLIAKITTLLPKLRITFCIKSQTRVVIKQRQVLLNELILIIT